MNRIANQVAHGAPVRVPTPPTQPPVAGRGIKGAGQRRLLLAAVGTALLVASVACGFFFGKRDLRPTPGTTATPAPQAQMLETLGSLSVTHLYQSYLNIGMLGDAVETGAYTLAQANDMLATVVNLMNAVDQQLDKLAKQELTEEDKRDVERIQELSVLLKLQVAALRVYWLTNDAQEVQRYQAARTRTWTALSEVLGLE